MDGQHNKHIYLLSSPAAKTTIHNNLRDNRAHKLRYLFFTATYEHSSAQCIKKQKLQTEKQENTKNTFPIT